MRRIARHSGIGSGTYNAWEIVGKTLYAKKPVAIKRIARDSAPTVYTVPKGGTVGVVQSYLDAKPGERSTLYWEFYDNTGRSYFAKHDSNVFDTDKLVAQGTLTDAESQEQELLEDMSWWDRIWYKADQAVDSFGDGVTDTGQTLKKTLQGVIIAGGVVLVGMMVLKTVEGNRKRDYRNFSSELSKAARSHKKTKQTKPKQKK